jgi:hypothetical protein
LIECLAITAYYSRPDELRLAFQALLAADIPSVAAANRDNARPLYDTLSHQRGRPDMTVLKICGQARHRRGVAAKASDLRKTGSEVLLSYGEARLKGVITQCH